MKAITSLLSKSSGWVSKSRDRLQVIWEENELQLRGPWTQGKGTKDAEKVSSQTGTENKLQ